MKINNKKFYSIYILNIINGLSFSLLIPVYPLFIIQYEQPVIILWVFSAIFWFFQMFWWTIMWSLSDKYWRRPILMFTQFGTFISWLIIALAYFLPNIDIFNFISLPILAIFLSRAIDWVTWWNESVANAYISDISTKKERTVVFGYVSALFWFTLIVWTWLWAFSMASDISYLWTAILWAFFSFLALLYIWFNLKESLKKENRNNELKITFKELNLISWLKKWWSNDFYKWLFLLKIFIFSVFAMYITTFSLYVIDVFDFDPTNIWYYLSFTWAFIIINQAYFVKKFVSKFWDFITLLIGLLLVPIWFILMYFNSYDIYIFTAVYFIANLGFALIVTIVWALLSKNADEKKQWEIMWIDSSISAFIFIYWPVVWGYIYWLDENSLYLKLWTIMVFAIPIYFKYLWKHKI